MRVAAALLLVALLAGCLNSPPPNAGLTCGTCNDVMPTQTLPTTSTPRTTTTAPTPADDVAFTVTASSTTIHPGQATDLVLSATNHRNTTMWTNVGIVCTGSWDLRLFDANGTEVRIDDRDSMGCASGGTLAGTIAPGATATFNDSWDGTARPRLGSTEPLPPGDYTFRGSVRYADHEGAQNADGAAGVFTRNASVDVHVTA